MGQLTKLIDSINVVGLKNIMPTVGIASATTVMYFIYKFVSSSVHREKGRGLKEIPSPGSCYPYVGHMFSLGELPGKTISEWHRELGPVIHIKMGCQYWISVDDPFLAHQIFVTHGAHASFRPYTTFTFEYYSFKGKGIAFSQPNESWNHSRSVVQSVLGSRPIKKNYIDYIHKESLEFVKRVINSTESNGGSTDPLKCLELFTLNVMFNVCFGKSFNCIDDPEFLKLAGMVEEAVTLGGLDKDLPNFLPALAIGDYFFGTQVRMKNFINNKRNPVYRKLIQEAFKKEGPNIIKYLGETDYAMDEDDMLVFISDLITAGTDTVAITLSWNYAIMCRYPDLQKRIAAEIDEFIKMYDRVPNFEERNQIPLCISVMKECMRYRPTTPFGISHTTDKDILVDGYLIPKDSIVIANMGSMHKNADRYDNPDKFIPERFMDNLKTMLASANGGIETRDHYNFGFGRRICPGIYLAEVEIFFAFVELFARCFIEPNVPGEYPDIDGAKDSGLAVMPLPYNVKFTRRANALI